MSQNRETGDAAPEWVRVAAYVTGGGTPSERAETARWIAADPHRAQAVERLYEAWTSGDASPQLSQGPHAFAVGIAQAWDGLRQRTGVRARLQESVPVEALARFSTSSAREPHARGMFSAQRNVTERTVDRSWIVRRAPTRSGIAMLTGALALVGTVVLIHEGGGRRLSVNADVRSYATTAGQRATLTLSDGSRVTLAPQSVLQVGSAFGRDARTVSLRGEAYFDIATSNGTPFIVRTGDVDTRVLGTRFDVRYYDGDIGTQVAVAAGKVSVGGAPSSTTARHRPSIILSAGMVGTVTDSAATAIAVEDVTAYTQWVDGKLVMHDTPVPQALATLGRWYGLEFRIQDSAVTALHITNTFEYGSQQQMLHVLKEVLGVRMSFDGHTVTLTSRRPAVLRAPARREMRDSLIPSNRSEVGR